jgi:hypothetical protein
MTGLQEFAQAGSILRRGLRAGKTHSIETLASRSGFDFFFYCRMISRSDLHSSLQPRFARSCSGAKPSAAARPFI